MIETDETPEKAVDNDEKFTIELPERTIDLEMPPSKSPPKVHHRTALMSHRNKSAKVEKLKPKPFLNFDLEGIRGPQKPKKRRPVYVQHQSDGGTKEKLEEGLDKDLIREIEKEIEKNQTNLEPPSADNIVKEMSQQCNFDEVQESNNEILTEANKLMSKTSKKFVNLSIGNAIQRKFSIPNQEIKFQPIKPKLQTLKRRVNK